jgi:hypothetical protein
MENEERKDKRSKAGECCLQENPQGRGGSLRMRNIQVQKVQNHILRMVF